MFTTHGAHIPGTRLGDPTPLIQPARCGGVEQCPDCMLEAAAVTNLDYFREDHHDDQTLKRVFYSMRKAGVSWVDTRAAIETMSNDGILFRERKHNK